MSLFYPQVTHNIGGNTSGTTANISSGTLVLAGGNNITLSQNANSITISAGAGGGTGGDAIRGIAAGGSTQTTNTVNFSNSNGVSFGFGAAGNSTVITASHNGLTSQSTQYLAVELGGNKQGTISFNATDNATIHLHGGSNITLSGSGNTITIIGTAGTGAGDGIRGIAAGGSTQTTNTVNFSNSNGISFGFGAAGNSTVLTASHNGLTSQSTQFLAIELGGNTAGTTSFNASNNASIFLHGGSNITLSGNGSSITISGASGGGGATPIVYRFPVELVSMNTVSVDSGAFGNTGGSTQITATIYVNPKPQPVDVHFNQIANIVSFGANAGTGSATINLMYGIYTLTESTLSLVSSFHFAMLATQNSAIARTHRWWWGTNSTANSTSTTGNRSSVFSGERRIILWTGTNATFTSNNYYHALGIYVSTSSSNVYILNRIFGEFVASQPFLNQASASFGQGLQGYITTSTNTDVVANGLVMPNSFSTAAITSSSVIRNYGIQIYSKY